MQYKSVFERWRAEEFRVHSWIFFGSFCPALLLKTCDVERVDLLTDMSLRSVLPHIGADSQIAQIWRVRGDKPRIVKFVAQPPIDVLRQIHTLCRHEQDVGAEARKGIDQGMHSSAASQIPSKATL